MTHSRFTVILLRVWYGYHRAAVVPVQQCVQIVATTSMSRFVALSGQGLASGVIMRYHFTNELLYVYVEIRLEKDNMR